MVILLTLLKTQANGKRHDKAQSIFHPGCGDRAGLFREVRLCGILGSTGTISPDKGQGGQFMNAHNPALETDSDEGSIVARAQDGDLEAFEYLVLSYQDRLFRLAYRMLNDRTDAEDVVQETLMTSWRSLPMLADVNAFGGWIYRLATNKCLDLLRQRSARAETSTDPAEMHSTADNGANRTALDADPVASAEWAAQREGLTAVLHTLPDVQRACWLLREIHGRSYAEIALTLEISPTTVRGTLARARQRIAERMSQWR